MKFVLIQKQELSKNTVCITSNAFYSNDFQEVVEAYDLSSLREELRIPPKQIIVKAQGKYLTAGLLTAITPCYLRGSKIVINGVEFPVCNKNPQYFFVWQDKVPSSLPNYLKEAYANFKLRGDLYKELVQWNQERIELAKRYSKFKWALAEDFYKEVFKTFYGKLKVLSPNKKTFFEATAEIELDNWIKPSAPLTKEEQEYLDLHTAKQYVKALGLPDTTFQISSKHRITEHGITDEPILTCKQDIANNLVASFFKNKHKGGEKSTQWNSTASTYIVSHTKERENIAMLKWYLSLPREQLEEFFLPGWHFCPVCGKLFHETEGCLDNNNGYHIDPIEFVPYDENHEKTLWYE